MAACSQLISLKNPADTLKRGHRTRISIPSDLSMPRLLPATFLFPNSLGNPAAVLGLPPASRLFAGMMQLKSINFGDWPS